MGDLRTSSLVFVICINTMVMRTRSRKQPPQRHIFICRAGIQYRTDRFFHYFSTNDCCLSPSTGNFFQYLVLNRLWINQYCEFYFTYLLTNGWAYFGGALMEHDAYSCLRIQMSCAKYQNSWKERTLSISSKLDPKSYRGHPQADQMSIVVISSPP